MRRPAVHRSGGWPAEYVANRVLSGPVGWVVMGIGALTAGTGLGFMGSGVAHAIDAVNIHNDAASEIRPAPVR